MTAMQSTCISAWLFCTAADLRRGGLLGHESLDLVPQRLRLLLDRREPAPQDPVLALQPLRRLRVRRGLRLEPAS